MRRASDCNATASQVLIGGREAGEATAVEAMVHLPDLTFSPKDFEVDDDSSGTAVVTLLDAHAGYEYGRFYVRQVDRCMVMRHAQHPQGTSSKACRLRPAAATTIRSAVALRSSVDHHHHHPLLPPRLSAQVPYAAAMRLAPADCELLREAEATAAPPAGSAAAPVAGRLVRWQGAPEGSLLLLKATGTARHAPEVDGAELVARGFELSRARPVRVRRGACLSLLETAQHHCVLQIVLARRGSFVNVGPQVCQGRVRPLPFALRPLVILRIARVSFLVCDALYRPLLST